MARAPLLTHRVLPMPPGATLPGSLNPECFGCGPGNPHGLQLAPRLEGDKVVAELRLAPHLAGGPGVAHGGVLATYLDELMGHVAVAHRIPAVTARLEVDFLRPLRLGTRVAGEAWLAGREGRKLWMEALGRDEAGEACLEARAVYLAVGLEHFAGALAGLSEEQAARLRRFRSDGFYP